MDIKYIDTGWAIKRGQFKFFSSCFKIQLRNFSRKLPICIAIFVPNLVNKYVSVQIL